MKTKIDDATEECILAQMIAVAADEFGLTIAAERTLVDLLLRDHQEIELPGVCGKVRLGARYLKEVLRVRVALSPEAIAGRCDGIAIRWAQRAYHNVAVEYPEVAHLVEALVVKTNPDGVRPELLHQEPQKEPQKPQRARTGV